MEIAFRNQTLQNQIGSLTIGSSDFDMLSRVSAIQNGVKLLKEMNMSLDSILDGSTYRQKTSQAHLEDILNRFTIEKSLLNLPLFSKGKIDNLAIYTEDSKTLEWEEIFISSSEDGIVYNRSDMSFTRIGNKIFSQQLGFEYSIVRLKLPVGVYSVGATIHKNISDIKSIKVKNAQNVWQSIDTTVGLASLVIERQNHIFLNEVYSELELVVKNTLIGADYYLDLDVKGYARKKQKDFINIKWEKGLPVNGLFLNLFMAGASYAEGSLYIGDLIYDFQLPAGGFGAITLSRLVKESSSSLFTTIGRCPYPVSTNNLPVLSSNIEDLENSELLETIPSWDFSLDKETWYPNSEFDSFEYPGLSLYSDTPRYMYFRVSGYYENIYISYRTKSNINCAWPLSEDGIIYYDGNALLIHNSENKPVSFELNVLLSSDSENNFQKDFPIGFIGID